MMPTLTTYRHALLFPALLVLAASCAQTVSQEQLSQEYLGLGIVSGTLGEQKRLGACPTLKRAGAVRAD